MNRRLQGLKDKSSALVRQRASLETKNTRSGSGLKAFTLHQTSSSGFQEQGVYGSGIKIKSMNLHGQAVAVSTKSIDALSNSDMPLL